MTTPAQPDHKATSPSSDGQPAGDIGRYLKRLARYVLAERRLLLLSIAFGIWGLCLPFVYPVIIGATIDKVVVPQPVNGVVPSLAERTHWLILLTGIATATALAFTIVGYAKGHFTLQLGNRIVTRLRADLFDHFQKLSLQFYAKERTGGIVWRIAHEVQGVNEIIYAGVLLLLFDLVQLTVAVALLFSISWRLALALLSTLPLYVLVFRRLNPRVQAASDTVGRHISQITGNVQEQFSAMALVKTYSAEEREAARFLADNQQHYRHVSRQSHLGHMMGAMSEFLIHIGTTIIVGYGSYLALHGRQPLSAGDLMRFLGYTGILYAPVKRFAELNLIYQNSLASIRRVFRVFDINPKIQEKPDARTQPPQRGSIQFVDVHFRYADDSDESRIRLDEDSDAAAYALNAVLGQHWILNRLNFSVGVGERVALVGPSGSGKSSLVSLLPRLYDVQEGAVLVDGVDVRDYTLKALRASIAVVQQDSFLFSGTIRENLAYGNPDADQATIETAARAAHAHDFIMALPHRYETILGERGINLSGGQRQRLSIARALLKNPKILILDEATSALDGESEALVQEALERLMSNRTSLIIAHRLSTVRHADRILVLSSGRIVETGSHDELCAADGVYARLVRREFR